jgi:hypothetical protein
MLRRERCPTLAFPADGEADFRGTFPDTPIFSMIHLHSTIVPRVVILIFRRFFPATDPDDSQIPDPPGRARRGGDGPRSWIVEKSTGRSLKTAPAGA